MMSLRMRRWAVAVLMISAPWPAHAAKPPKLAKTTDKIFQMVGGVLIVPALDESDRLLRPDLRQDAEIDSPPLPANFQTPFFKHAGLQKYPTVWIFSPESGEIHQVKSADLRIGEPNWGESSGSLENIHVLTGLPPNVCPGGDCLAIVAPQCPFKKGKLKLIPLTDPPAAIAAKTFGIQESDFGAVKLNYSKRPNGAEFVVLQTFKQDSTVRCGNGGIAEEDTGYVRAPGGAWREVYSKFIELDATELSPKNVANFVRPAVSVGVPAAGDEVISVESSFIFLDKNSVIMTPVSEPGNGMCVC